MEIGVKLKEARIKSGLTQENVAEKIQVSRQTISNWENEKSFPDIVNVIKLITLNMFIPDNHYFLVGIFCLMVITSSALLYQIIKKF